MAAVSESETKILDPHIPRGEELIEAYCGNEKTIAVTDRRVIDLRHREGNRKQETELTSTLLTTDYIIGTRYGREQESSFPGIEFLIALVMGLIGLGGVGFVGPAGLVGVLGLVGLRVGVAAPAGDDAREGADE